MGTIFVGILFITISFDLGVVSSFLPAFGLMLIYVKLRRYRMVSRYFYLANMAVEVMMFVEVVIVFLKATPLNLSAFVNMGVLLLNAVLQAWFLVCLAGSIQEEFERQGTTEFKGTAIIGLAAGNFLLIIFLIAGFKLGTVICLLIIIAFLIGVYRFLLEAGRNLSFINGDYEPAKPGDKVLWVGYTVLIALSVSGGMFLGSMHTDQLIPKEETNTEIVKALAAKGIDEEVARDLSLEDTESLQAVDSFMEIGARNSGRGVRLFAGMTDEDDYKLVLWYEDLGGIENSSLLGREIIEVSRTDRIGKCTGRVYYTRDGEDSYMDISAEKKSIYEGKELLTLQREAEAVETVYAEVSLRVAADHVRGYLILDGFFPAQANSGAIYTELFDVNFIQFPYKNAKQSVRYAERNGKQKSFSFALTYKLQ